MDKVFIQGLKLQAVIGVFSWEQQMRQPLLVDLVLHGDTRPAAASDDLVDALDYAAIATQLQHWLDERRFQLLEALADYLAGRLLSAYPIDALQLRLTKPAALAQATAVGVEIFREARR